MKYLIHQQVSSGFFSDFNVIVGCLNFCYTQNINEFTIIWNTIRYSDNAKINLFDTYFYHNKYYNTYNHYLVANDVGATYYKPVNDHSIYCNSSFILNHYNYFNNAIYQNCLNGCVKAKNSLGIHIRGTDHSQHAPLLNLNYYVSTVEKKLNEHNFDYIFVATDEQKYLDVFKEKWGERVIYNDVIRSLDGQIIHHFNQPQKSKLITDVMTDALSLTVCDEILLTSSNIAGYVLSINPNIKHTFIDLHLYA